ncbi:hypothetical protein Tco_0911883 [Tanacetum coccineum]
MPTKNSLAIQRCELSRKELDEFPFFYLIPSKYRVILPTSSHTILHAPPGYIGLYTHCFSLANLRLPLNDFFCKVLQYFKVHISRLNPFGCSKLTTFIVMCKAYDCEPSVELFHGFFNLCKAGSWLTFQKRSEKHISSLLDKVITRIEGWHQRFFFIQDTFVPSKFPQLLLKENMIGVKSFKDKLPSGIEQNPQFQRLGRYPVSACAFDDPILFLMSFRNFIYTEDDEDLTFLPKDSSLGFNTGSPYVSISIEPLRTDKEPVIEPATEPTTEPVNERMNTIADSRGSPKGDTFVIHAGSVAARIRERKCKTREGSLRPLVKRKLASSSSTSCTVHGKVSVMKDDTHVLSISDDEGLDDCLKLKDDTDCHLKIFAITPPSWKGFLDNQLDVDLLDLHDHCYARQAIVDNAVNRRSRELLKVIEKMRGEADIMRASELAPEEEYEGLRARLMLESQKWSGYQMSLSDLESKVASLESEKANLEATKALLSQEIEELLHIDKLGRLVGKLVSLAITFGRCKAYKQVIKIKEPFDLSKIKGYRPSYKKEHTQASNDLATATFSWLNETHMHVPSFQLATPSSAPSSKPMSPSTDIVKLTSSPNE